VTVCFSYNIVGHPRSGFGHYIQRHVHPAGRLPKALLIIVLPIEFFSTSFLAAALLAPSDSSPPCSPVTSSS